MFRTRSPDHHQVTSKYESYTVYKTHFDELQCLAFSKSIVYLCPDNGLVVGAETFCHLVTLN
jgi:hypothetical protein